MTVSTDGKVILYIAASLDGFIARKDHDISWLDALSRESEDYGFPDFIRSCGAAIMGARTYEESLKHPERMLAVLKTYVLSTRPMPVPAGANVEFYHGELGDLVERIRRETAGTIWLVGGGQVVASFLNAGLVDELLQFVVPILLGEGIPLYTPQHRESSLKLVEALVYRSGIVKLHYVLNRH